MSVNISFHQVKSIKAELKQAVGTEHYWLILKVVHEERQWNNPQHFEESEYALFPLSLDDFQNGSDPKVVEAFRKIATAISEAFPEHKSKMEAA